MNSKQKWEKITEYLSDKDNNEKLRVLNLEDDDIPLDEKVSMISDTIWRYNENIRDLDDNDEEYEEDTKFINNTYSKITTTTEIDNDDE